MSRHNTETCPTCGSTLDALHCARLERCKACGRKNPAGFAFCGHCGVSMGSLDDEVDPFDAMLEEVISSMDPDAEDPQEPLVPDLLPEVHSLPRPVVATPAAKPMPKPKPRPKVPAKVVRKSAPKPSVTKPPSRSVPGKPPTTKKLATSTKRKAKPALPPRGFHRPAAPPVSGQHGTVTGKSSSVTKPATPAVTRPQAPRRSSTMPSVPQEQTAVAAMPQPPSRTGYTTVVPALQPPRPFSSHPPQRVPTSRIKAAPQASAEPSEPSAAQPRPQRPRRRRSTAFGADVLARYNKR